MAVLGALPAVQAKRHGSKSGAVRDKLYPHKQQGAARLHHEDVLRCMLRRGAKMPSAPGFPLSATERHARVQRNKLQQYGAGATQSVYRHDAHPPWATREPPCPRLPLHA